MTERELPQDWLTKLRQNLATQDNRITKHPVFVVQQRQRIVGVDDDYTDDHVWMDEDGNRCDAPEDENNPPKDWTRVGYIDRWEFVTACFTEQGCKDYIAVNGHNLCEPRIYVESAHRNREWQRLREYLATAAPTPGEAAEPEPNIRWWKRGQPWLPATGLYGTTEETEQVCSAAADRHVLYRDIDVPGGAGFSVLELDSAGKLELRLHIEDRHVSVGLSRDMWEVMGEKAGWPSPPCASAEVCDAVRTLADNVESMDILLGHCAKKHFGGPDGSWRKLHAALRLLRTARFRPESEVRAEERQRAAPPPPKEVRECLKALHTLAMETRGSIGSFDDAANAAASTYLCYEEAVKSCLGEADETED